MALGYWVLFGAFAEAVGGAIWGVGDALMHYHYPYNPRYDIYPLSITVATMAAGDAIMSLIPGAILGGIIGARVRSAQTRRALAISREARANRNVWPPPPRDPAV